LPKFVIEREIPGAGSMSAQQLQGVAAKSCSVLRDLGPRIQWVQSFVTDDKSTAFTSRRMKKRCVNTRGWRLSRQQRGPGAQSDRPTTAESRPSDFRRLHRKPASPHPHAEPHHYDGRVPAPTPDAATDNPTRALPSLHEFFAPGGILARSPLPYEYRPGQLQMAKAVERALEERRHLIVEAGTAPAKLWPTCCPPCAPASASSSPPAPRPCRTSSFSATFPSLKRCSATCASAT